MRRTRWIANLLVAGIALSASVSVHAAAAVSGGDAFSPQIRLGFQSGDDWEPSIAADRYGHLYALYKHYDVTGGATCDECNLHHLLQRSDDGGKTWSSPTPIAPGPVLQGQHDPQIAVDPVDGRTVWASFMQHSLAVIQVTHSVDFGRTWSTPVTVSAGPPNNDKDSLAVRGNHVVVAYDDGLNTWAAISDDGGAHWRQQLVFAGTRRFHLSLSAGAAIDSRNRIFVSWDSFDQAHAKLADGPTTMWVSSSTDDGSTWTRTVLAQSGMAPSCDACGWDFLGAQMALAVGVDDIVYVLWQASAVTNPGGPERMFFSRSTDHGRTYAPGQDVSMAPAGTAHAFPAIAGGRTPGEVGIAWTDTRAGAWNVFYRQSSSRGDYFGPVVQVSSYVPGYAYLTASGFGLPYGDYFQLTFDSRDRVVTAFGEGPNYTGPGNIWFSRQAG